MDDSHDPALNKPTLPRRARTKPLVRHILPSDNHGFIGRVYELSIVSLNFDSYEEMAQYPDVKYALEVNYALKGLTRRWSRST
ncbi:hypothetical protein [Rhizobium leguminosarum]|uniref:hypothetical protein n=1 Tax=Rhizobium leguminosarum TaxID=384 RepID=UPI0021BBD1D7|nr:hypothetical protein [Rhizobium leguminosarum]